MNDQTQYGEFDDILIDISVEHQQICNALRKMIRDAAPDTQEIVWVKQKIASYGFGPKKMSEHYNYIAPQKNHVNLGFYCGADLTDDQKLLEGSGKKLRHIKIHHIDDLANSAVADLVKAAIIERRLALAKYGATGC